VDGRDGLKVVKFAIRAQVVNPDAAAAAAKPAAAPVGPATPPPAAKAG
jgi:hypothetical protein